MNQLKMITLKVNINFLKKVESRELFHDQFINELQILVTNKQLFVAFFILFLLFFCNNKNIIAC